jgi:2,3-dihydroxyphenylpropionate 1,2-dioxygenase
MPVNAAFASHSPLMSIRSPDSAVEAEVRAGFDGLAAAVAAYDPELVILLGTDHYFGFFYDVMPAFCIGMAAHSAADYGMPAGDLSVAGETAGNLTSAIHAANIDIAVSHNMRVDHGFTHTLQMLFGGIDKVPVVPIFLNCAAPPFPPLTRTRKLGEAIGQFARGLEKRVLVIASGGLSHDPPTPQLGSAPPPVREMILGGGRNLTDEMRDMRLQRLLNVTDQISGNEVETRPLNPAWDEAFIDQVIAGDFDSIATLEDQEIDKAAGRGGHEIRTWLAAAAALDGGRPNGASSGAREIFRYYRAVDEWLCGMGLLYVGGS